MRLNNDARVDLKRRMIVLTGTRCTYFEFKTTHKSLDFSLITQHIHAHVSMETQEYRGIGEVTIVTTRSFSQGSENGRCSYDWGR
jgi:hypothetical protein